MFSETIFAELRLSQLGITSQGIFRETNRGICVDHFMPIVLQSQFLRSVKIQAASALFNDLPRSVPPRV